MIGNSDEIYEKHILAMPCIAKNNFINVETIRANSPNLKYFLDEEKSLEKYCTEKVFKHVMSKKNLFESKNCKSLIRAGVPIKYLTELLIKLFNITPENKFCENHIANYEKNFRTILKSYDAKDFADYVPYYTGMNSLQDSLPVNYLNEQGILRLKEILWMLNSSNVNIEFCPILVKVVSLLLVFCAPEEVYGISKIIFDLNCKIIDTFKIRWHLRFSYGDNQKIVGSICESLRDISNKSGKETFQHFDNINFPAEKLYEDMVFGFFMDYLSFSGVLRLLPFFLLEGVKSLYRMCYAIVKTLRLEILKIKNPDDVIKTVRGKAKEIVDLNKLFNLAYSYKLTRNNNKYEFQKVTDQVSFSQKINSFYLPAFPKSSIINSFETLRIWEKFPQLTRAKDAKLIFDPSNDGYSLKNIYNLTTIYEQSCPILFLLETYENEAFGGYVSNLFKHSGDKFIKPLESYLISIRPTVEVYLHGKNVDQILMCNNNFIMFGNGSNGPAIFINDSLDSGRSNGDNCFSKDRLIKSEDGAFKIKRLEIYLLE